MQSLFKLKSMERKFQSVIISHDMTILETEREECKALVEEAKQKTINETGDFIYRVRDTPGCMHIVRIHKTH